MAKVTSAQRLAAKNLLEIAKGNAATQQGQLTRTLQGYDKAEQVAKDAAGVQFEGNSRTTSADRFAQLKSLQGSAKGILGSAGNALQGSQLGGLSEMLRERNDMDTTEALGTLRQNQQGVQGELTSTQNQLANSRRDAIDTATIGLRGIEADTAAQLNTLNSKLYKKAGKGKLNFGSGTMAARYSKVPTVKAQASGYFLPDAAAPASAPGSAPQGTSYFDKLMNLYNQRSA